jgi:polar amino acid transport system substrate-binding protein
MKTRRCGSSLVWLGLTAGVAVLGLSGVPSPGSAAEVVQEARDALPDSVKDAGVLRLATSLQWPPFGYKDDNGEPEGIDIDLITVLAEKLGLTLEITDVKFPSIIPGVETGRFDIGANQLSRQPEREKVVQFVVYFRSYLGLLVRRGVTDVDVDHLCGRTLALTQGSAQIKVAEQLSKDCVAQGKDEIGFLFYPNSADTYLAVANGRGDGFLTGQAVGVYIAKHNDKLHMTKSTLAETASIAGIVVDNDNDQLAEALQIALVSAIEDGSYMKILEEYGAEDGALTAEEVRNPPDR